MTEQGQTLVICARAPPQISGTGTVMYELLRHFPKHSVVVFSRAQRSGISRDDRILPLATYEIGRASSITYATFARLLLLPVLIFSILLRTKLLAKRPANVVVVHPDLDFLLAGLAVSRILDVPVFVYLHDCIVETATQIMDKTPSKLAERWVFSKAKKVYAMSVPMEKYYDARGLKTEALPHGVDPKLLRHPLQMPCSQKPIIGFAGAVYETNGSAIKDLVEAKKLMGGKLELQFSTSQQSIPYLKKLGVLESLDKVSTLAKHSEVLDFLASCDILFVPMSFESPNYKDLQTIFPTKVTDYWLAQKPIIVYGPKEYAFVSLAERDGYAKVVTKRGPEAISEAIREVCGSRELSLRLVRMAKGMTELHNSSKLAKRLMFDLGISEGEG